MNMKKGAFGLSTRKISKIGKKEETTDLASRLLEVIYRYAKASRKDKKSGIDTQLFSKLVFSHLTKEGRK
jgi:hypothetical protein